MKNECYGGNSALRSGPTAGAAVLPPPASGWSLAVCCLTASAFCDQSINHHICCMIFTSAWEEANIFQEALWRGLTFHVRCPGANMLWHGMTSNKQGISLECVLETWGVLDGIWHLVCLEVNILMTSRVAVPLYNYKLWILSGLKEIKLFSKQLPQSDSRHMGNG